MVPRPSPQNTFATASIDKSVFLKFQHGGKQKKNPAPPVERKGRRI
jgi:hypothetical protein